MNTNTLIKTIALVALPLLTLGQAAKPVSLPLVSGKDAAVVGTAYGKVRGYIHNGIFTFKGIPYAKAKRFMAPSKPDSWTGVRSSMSYGPVCPLMDPTTTVNDESEFVFHHDWGYPNEDCLRLNIWSKGVNDGKKRPVMVWLHGGGHTAGSSQELPSYDGENISKKGDVVLVSINHRLNILGFLDLSAYGDQYKASPNNSVHDMIAALQWVKANIAGFGGDPDNVTIFGQSGGGGKVNTLLNTPSAKGLFSKAIIQSGGLGLQFNDQTITRRISALVLEEFNLNPGQVDSLQSVPFEKLAAAGKKAIQKVQAQLTKEGKPLGPFGWSWAPVLDGNLLPYQPVSAEAKAISANIPLLIGSTKNEFAPFFGMGAGPVNSMADVRNALTKQYGDKADAYIAAVKKAYPETQKPEDFLNIDDMFRRSAIKMADLKAASPAPVYMYLFTWQSPVVDGKYKSLHCMEIPFVFDNIGRCEEMTGGGKEAYVLADKMSQSWINFARTGNPGHKGLPSWKPYTPQNGAAMLFDNQCVEKTHHDKDILAIAPDRAL
ncbi:carboxylesterase/lipase family protein [Arsenicibacter rosenii]|uniref:Carboxylic ester hydrolase n=1 Tax=Arsenicibacter rosenii TaxID=1750698 RepID=A0A1S2VAT9_9BACT|nr:carboxylesterase family protein [Arsenicibacter rosenii]OIN55530.1 carboxylesterase [Arsenicibacter rosenii]